MLKEWQVNGNQYGKLQMGFLIGKKYILQVYFTQEKGPEMKLERARTKP